VIFECKPAFDAKKPSWQHVLNHHKDVPQERLYALVDGALNETLLASLQNWPVDTYLSIYADLPEGNAPEVTPLLILIDPEGNPSAQRVFNRLLIPQIIQPESLMFLWSDWPMDELAAHLGRHAQITTSAGKRALLRFQDPNILPAALAVQTDEEQAIFFSGLTEVWYPDLDEIWWSYRRTPPIEPRAFQPVQWDEARHARFAKLTRPRKILFYLEEEHPEHLPGSRAAWLDTFRAWLDEAESRGIVTANDQTVYCVAALFAGDRFAEDPEIANELNAIGTRHDSFSKAIQAVSEESWARLEKRNTPRTLYPKVDD
jgi:hypothetical protein